MLLATKKTLPGRSFDALVYQGAGCYALQMIVRQDGLDLAADLALVETDLASLEDAGREQALAMAGAWGVGPSDALAAIQVAVLAAHQGKIVVAA